MKGFKEWQVVCDALASGRQAIILRQGGIHEGGEGFSFGAESFFLFPPRFHNQNQFVREGEVDPKPEWEPGEEVTITPPLPGDLGEDVFATLDAKLLELIG